MGTKDDLVYTNLVIVDYEQIVRGSIYSGITSLFWWFDNKYNSRAATAYSVHVMRNYFPFLELCAKMYDEDTRNTIFAEIAAFHVYSSLRRMAELSPGIVEPKSQFGIGECRFVSNAANQIGQAYADASLKIKKRLFGKKLLCSKKEAVISSVKERVRVYSKESAFESEDYTDGLGTPHNIDILCDRLLDILQEYNDIQTAKKIAKEIVVESLKLASSVRVWEYNRNKQQVDLHKFIEHKENRMDITIDPIWSSVSAERRKIEYEFSKSILFGISMMREKCRRIADRFSVGLGKGTNLVKELVEEIDAYTCAALRLCYASGRCVRDKNEFERAVKELSNDGFSEKRFASYINLPDNNSMVDYLGTDLADDVVRFANYIWYLLVHRKKAEDDAFMATTPIDTIGIVEREQMRCCFMEFLISVYDDVIDRAEGKCVPELMHD